MKKIVRVAVIMIGFLACGSKSSVLVDGCPKGFVRLTGAQADFCISAYEMHLAKGLLGRKDQGTDFPDGSTRVKELVSEAGRKPTQTSWYQAYAACKDAGWHLCSSEEWEQACDGQVGPGGRVYPTPDGEVRVAQCAIGSHREGYSAPLSLTGAYEDCHTPGGVYDMLGNLWEWTDPRERNALGLPVVDKRGGGHYGATSVKCSRNAYAQHPPEWDGTIGFRCCTQPD